jgi:hypothetical protein
MTREAPILPFLTRNGHSSELIEREGGNTVTL